jgi:NADH-quinone oxidoreductase subunit L
MRGFRKAMPFTFGCFVIGSLALAAFPLMSGFFSKDAILYEIGQRGGWWIVLVVCGFVGSIFTVFYTWRLVFRAFYGEPCEQARELEGGHLYHPPAPVNPANGEPEDTDVGFPGEEHHIAERTPQMRIAMSVLALLSVLGGIVFLPFGITEWFERFLEPTFEGSIVSHPDKTGLEVFGVLLTTAIALGGLWLSYRIWVARPGTSAAIQARFAALHRLFVNKWYFDEAIDLLVVRPLSWAGRWARDSFERVVVNGIFVGGSTGVVRAGSAAVRALQTGLLRGYAALVIGGLAAVLLYFLIRSA